MAKLVAENLNESVQSRGKTQQILDFIREAGPEGRRYTDIIRFAYNLSYGEGSYDADTEPTKTTDYGDWKGRSGGNPHRGYWSGAFKTPSRDDRGFGHLMKYIIKADNGNWILRDEKMTSDEANDYGRNMEWPGKNQYKQDAYPSTRGDYDEKGNYRPRITKKYADSKKARGEWSPDHDNAYQIIDDED